MIKAARNSISSAESLALRGSDVPALSTSSLLGRVCSS
jgi:hypothetical protein